jgi:hypothetical protein
MNIAAITVPITKPCSRRAGLNLWVLPGFRIVLDNVIYGMLKAISQEASLAITSARILVVVDIC